MNVTPSPAAIFDKSVHLGDRDFLYKRLEIPPGCDVPLNIVLSSATGNIEGEIDAPASKSNELASCWSPSVPFHTLARFYYSAVVEDNGKFKINGVAPRKYKIFALEKIATASYRNQESAELLEALGEDLEVTEGAKVQSHPKLIPQAKAKEILKPMKSAWLFLLASISLSAQTTAGTDQTGGIAGVVTDAMTHLPIKKVSISVMLVGNMGGARVRPPTGGGGVGSTQAQAPQVIPQGPQSTTTDASGAYSVTNLQAGSYRITFQQSSYPAARFGGVVKQITVKPGETTGSVNTELMPGASISGRITDEDGDPLPNCYVQIMNAKSPDQGVMMSGMTNSNTEGEYRGYGISAGKFIIAARCQQPLFQARFQARPFSSGPDIPPALAYAPQYYPLATELKAAQLVELVPGSEKAGVDFRMRPTAVTQVRGTLSPTGADWHGVNNLNFQLLPVDQTSPRFFTGAPFDQSKGTFEFRQVFPGSYNLIAFSNGGQDGGRVGLWQRIDVADQPLNLGLELKKAVDIAGKVEVDVSSNSNVTVQRSQMNMQMIPKIQVGMPGSNTQVSEDGTFVLKGVLPGLFHLQINVPQAFVKSIFMGSTDVTEGYSDFSNGPAAGFEFWSVLIPQPFAARHLAARLFTPKRSKTCRSA